MINYKIIHRVSLQNFKIWIRIQIVIVFINTKKINKTTVGNLNSILLIYIQTSKDIENINI